jgi:NO-binding membrane sensor protein with MHYT domain
MQVAYGPWLALLSLVMAALGGYVGFGLASQIGSTAGLRKRGLIAGAALSFAVAAWCMHFIGMLAVRWPFPVAYLIFPTLLSFLVCALVVGIAIFVASEGVASNVRLIFSGCLMGLGIFLMQGIGVTALGANAATTQSLAAMVASLAIAVALSGVALWLAAGEPGRWSVMLAAIVFGVAVAGAHYMGMAGLTLAPLPIPSAAPALSHDDLAIVVAVVAFGLCGIFLLLLVPDRMAPASESAKWTPAILAAEENGSSSEAVVTAGGDSDLRRGIFAPLGGVGAPPPRIAEQLPIERDGATQFVPVDEVVAVQANAHYTFLFNGSAKLFCPLAIGEVESRLDRSRFIRVHRSHIINIERVVGYKKSGDTEIVELAAENPYTVPVSRSRAGWLKSRIKEKNGGSDKHDPRV